MALKFKQLEAVLLTDLSLHKTVKTKNPTIRYQTSLLNFKTIAAKMGVKEDTLRFQWRRGKNMNPAFFEKILNTFDLEL